MGSASCGQLGPVRWEVKDLSYNQADAEAAVELVETYEQEV